MRFYFCEGERIIGLTCLNFRPSKSRMEAINEIIARSQTQAQNMLAAGGYFEETLRSITTPRGANNNYNDCSPDTSIASDFSFNSVSPVVMATYPSQAKSPRKQDLTVISAQLVMRKFKSWILYARKFHVYQVYTNLKDFYSVYTNYMTSTFIKNSILDITYQVHIILYSEF